MSFVRANLIERDSAPAKKREVSTTLSWNWADIEEILSAEWEIGGPAITDEAIRGLVANKLKKSEGI
jgi:hypothetical protein